MLLYQDSAFSIHVQKENSRGTEAVLMNNKAFLALQVQR